MPTNAGDVGAAPAADSDSLHVEVEGRLMNFFMKFACESDEKNVAAHSAWFGRAQEMSPEQLCETFVTRCVASVKAERIDVSDYLR